MNNDNQAKPVEEGRKVALLRYLAILFAVAFLLVLISMLTQLRSSRSAISELNQSSVSAAEKVQQLQDTNRDLETRLQAEKEANGNLLDALEEAVTKEERTRQAYELLLEIQTLSQGSREGNVALSRALDTMEELKQYLDPTGLAVYESLLEEVE